jgi:predicted phage terminase large subunit-like protein
MNLPPQRQLLQHSAQYVATEIYSYILNDHHLKILTHIQTSNQTIDLAPRGCGKSRIGNIAYVTQRVLQDPNIRILVTSDTDTHAVRFISTVKDALQYHPLIKRNFGTLVGPRWKEHEAEILGRDRIMTEATVTAAGAFSGAVTSGHYDLIICDDLVNFDNARTDASRERLWEWFKLTLYPTLIPGGEIHVLGTRYHFVDLYHRLIEEMDFDLQTQQAIITDRKGQERSIWEAFMPLKDRGSTIGLKTIQRQVGSAAFALQYQNDVSLMMKGDIYEYDWFRRATWQHDPEGARYIRLDDKTLYNVKDVPIFIGVDPAVSTSDKADWFAINVLAYIPSRDLYVVLESYRGHLSFDKRRAKVNQKYLQWSPRLVSIESNAAQDDFISALIEAYPYIRVKREQQTKDKVSRAWSRSGLVENGKVFVMAGNEDFITELVQMPDGDHDDQFDAWDMAMDGAKSPRGGMVRSKTRGSEKYQREGKKGIRPDFSKL